MMRPGLRRNIYWCGCGGRVILLDVEADRYFCLPPGAEAAFLRVAKGHPEDRDGERLQFLAARGMLVEDGSGAEAAAPQALPPPARGELFAERPTGPRLARLLQALVLELRMGGLLRFGSLSRLLGHLGRRRPGQPPQDRDRALRDIVAAFAATSFVLQEADRCLVRAAAVQAACRRAGIATSLVIGVQLDPFRAHAWVQFGDLVVVGGFEQVRLFTPIAAFG